MVTTFLPFWVCLKVTSHPIQESLCLISIGARSSKPARLPGPGIRPPGRRLVSSNINETSSLLSSELDSSHYDTEDVRSMASSRITTSTDHTSVSQQMLKNRQKKRSKRRAPAHLARAGSISSITGKTSVCVILCRWTGSASKNSIRYSQIRPCLSIASP